MVAKVPIGKQKIPMINHRSDELVKNEKVEDKHYHNKHIIVSQSTANV